ncbi:hypothetical protein EVAR_23369_1 [Eumeta japonica]|uniref:Mariner Mos1 transposase n=1 Tax=Eumeta variegata TaxID=151549 RepID=A0A4C1VVD9_EUMVA|nr:hypothetical protein EVAR_23369_1 [Eumeta japonica]
MSFDLKPPTPADVVWCVLHGLDEILAVRKLCTRWIPHDLTEGQKLRRVNWCRDMMQRFGGGDSNVVYNMVTGDESWIYCYDYETKRQSAQWVFPFEELTKIKRGRSVRKKMVASFFGMTGIKISDHPPYGPDLVPCDFYSFPKIKEKPREKWFMDAEDAVTAYENDFQTTLSASGQCFFSFDQRSNNLSRSLVGRAQVVIDMRARGLPPHRGVALTFSSRRGARGLFDLTQKLISQGTPSDLKSMLLTDEPSWFFVYLFNKDSFNYIRYGIFHLFI